MNYAEFVAKALRGRSVYAVSKAWGLNQMTAKRYTKGERIPKYSTAKTMAMDAGLNLADVFEILASEEEKRKRKIEITVKVLKQKTSKIDRLQNDTEQYQLTLYQKNHEQQD